MSVVRVLIGVAAAGAAGVAVLATARLVRDTLSAARTQFGVDDRRPTTPVLDSSGELLHRVESGELVVGGSAYATRSMVFERRRRRPEAADDVVMWSSGRLVRDGLVMTTPAGMQAVPRDEDAYVYADPRDATSSSGGDAIVLSVAHGWDAIKNDASLYPMYSTGGEVVHPVVAVLPRGLGSSPG